MEKAESNFDPEFPRYSYSQINSWLRCKLAWKLSNVDGWTSEKQPGFFSLGKLIHTFLEDYYTKLRQNPTAHESYFLDRLMEQVAILASSKDADYEEIAAAQKIVTRYIIDFALFADQGFEVLETEKHFEVLRYTFDGRPYVFHGYIDLLLRDIRSKRVVLVDHKSHNNKPMNATEVSMDPQLSDYAAALRELGYDISHAVHNMLNTYQYKDWKNTPVDKLFCREISYRTDLELDAIVETNRQIVTEIENWKTSGKPYFRTLKRDCSYCWFQAPCLFGLKGMDMDGILEASFVKRERFTAEIKESDSRL